MNLQTEVYISIDGENYSKIDLAKNESINMKYVLKDTTDLSKVFSPFSLSFTFPGTLNNQRIFGFIGNTKVYKPYSNNIFPCKIYSNGLLQSTGKLKVTEVREDNGIVKSFTANFTTTMLSLTTRMGDDTISDLPITPVYIDWTPNKVFDSVSSVKVADTEPRPGITAKYYTPLISRNRIFQRRLNTDGNNYLDNVAYVAGADPTSTKTLKTSELRPAIQGKTIIDLIKSKYNLDIEMPLEQTQEYKDWYIYCNAEAISKNTLTGVDFNVPLGLSVVSQNDDTGGDGLPSSPRYTTTLDLALNRFTVVQNNSFHPDRWGGDFQLSIQLNGVLVLDDSGTSDFLILVRRTTDDAVLSTGTYTSIGTTCHADINITDDMFVSGSLSFAIEIAPKQVSSWTTMDAYTIQEYYHHYIFLGINSVERRKWRYLSQFNNNSAMSGGGVIDLFKALPETKCTDFLNSFFKTFNISVFDASPSNDKLFWLTTKDLLVLNQAYSKKVTYYTPYIVSQAITKTIAADFTYYNFKHKTSKYKSNVDFLATHGLEFGQTTYPSIKPTENLNEFKVETGFSILEALPIAGMTDEFTSYGFNSDAPEVLDGGELRYKPNNNELTIFFACGLRNLIRYTGTGPFTPVYDKCLGFQKTLGDGTLTTSPLISYIKTSPVHTNGFSFGFSLIQTATVRSLYYDFYKRQTERLLNPNTLQQSFKLQLPASELVLNYATTTSGMSQVPDGFRLQNEIVLQENRFSIIDAQIDITTGLSTMNLLNF